MRRHKPHTELQKLSDYVKYVETEMKHHLHPATVSQQPQMDSTNGRLKEYSDNFLRRYLLRCGLIHSERVSISLRLLERM